MRKPGCKKSNYLCEPVKGTGTAHRRRPQEKGVPGKWEEKTPTKRRGQETLLECSYGVGDHKSNFANHGVVELADVQTGLLLELVDAVD